MEAHTPAPRTSGRPAAATPLSPLQSKSVLRVSLQPPQSFESLSFPGAFESLGDVSKLALVEYLFFNHDVHGSDDAVVKFEIDGEWGGSPLPYPLPTRDNPNSIVTMADVMSLLKFVTRRFTEENVTKDNTGAWRNREGLKATIERAIGEREKELVNDFGFFIRARRGNIIDQSLHLGEEGTTNDDGPAVKEARKRKFGEVG